MTSMSSTRELLTTQAYANNNFLLFITNKLNSERHQHPAVQLNISLSDEAICVDNDIDQVTGHYLLIGGNQPHRISSNCSWQAVLLLADQSALAVNLQKHFLPRGEFSCVLASENMQDLRNALLSLRQISQNVSQVSQHIYTILNTLNKLAVEHPSKPNKRIVKIFNQLGEHRNVNISHAKLAAAVALSDSHLSHLFREETGMTLRSYKLWQRTLNGTNLILEGKTITEASIESGFADTAHFSRSFKQRFGISPSTLKKHAQKVFWIKDNYEPN